MSFDLSSRRGLLLLASVNSVGGIIFGYNTGVITLALGPVSNTYFPTADGLNYFQQSLLTCSVLLGAIIGSGLGGVVVTVLGRKKTIFLLGALTIVGTVSSALVPMFWLVTVLRVVVGLGVGLASSACPLYVSEMCPPEHRGVLGCLFQLALCFGIMLANVLGFAFSFLMDAVSWRYMFIVGALPGVAMIIVALYLPESKVWLAQRKAEYGSVNGASPSSAFSSLLQIRNLFRRQYLHPLAVGIVLSITLQLTGINAIMYYAASIITGIGLDGEYSIPIVTIGIGAWNFISTFAATGLVDRVGRKPLMLIGVGIMAISDALLGGAFIMSTYDEASHGAVCSNTACKVMAVVGIFLFIAAFELGPGCLFWLTINEIFPTEVREAGASLNNLLQWTWNLLLAALFLILQNAIGPSAVFFIFCGVGTAAFLFLVIFFPEMKDKHADEFQVLEIEGEQGWST